MEQQDDLPKLWNYSYKTVGTQNASQNYFGGIDNGPTRGAFQGAQSRPRENQNDLVCLGGTVAKDPLYSLARFRHTKDATSARAVPYGV